MAELEATFGCPVIEAYGMTEAAHQMASQPAAAAPRKPGSVGLRGRPEVAIMDEQGDLLPPGETGEVVIRGPNVTPATRTTRSQRRGLHRRLVPHRRPGRLDEDGYLRSPAG
jgi:oxalate---CoA ligase